MAQQPPMPPLDGVPPSPPGLSAGGGPNPQISQLTPSMEFTGSLQVVQMSLEAAGQAAKLLDLLGQINPSFAPVAQVLIEQLKGGLKIALQQGSGGLEAFTPPFSQQQQMPPMPSPQETPGEPQQPLPAVPAGF
jgi:hypothetical protein